MEEFAERLGQAVLIEGKPQAGGNLAMHEAATSAPDGYTLIAAGIGPVVANAYLYKNPGFDAQKDFAPISLMQFLPSVLVVHPSLGINTVAELIALAKQRPGEITYGSWRVSSANRTDIGEISISLVGLSIRPVP